MEIKIQMMIMGKEKNSQIQQTLNCFKNTLIDILVLHDFSFPWIQKTVVCFNCNLSKSFLTQI